jgi:hypothetical protein
MRTLLVVMRQIFGDQMPQPVLTNGNAVVEAFLFERPKETFDERIAVGRLRRNADGFDIGGFQRVTESG